MCPESPSLLPPSFPLSSAEQELQQVTVEYETLPGWKCSTAGLTSFSALPPNAQAYVHRIEQLLKVPSESSPKHTFIPCHVTVLSIAPVQWVGTGPARDDIITM